MTKTARKLLDQAKANRFGMVSVQTGFFTGSRRPSYGARSHSALIELRDAGLVEFVSNTSSVYHLIGGRSADHSTEHTFRLTEAGKNAN